MKQISPVIYREKSPVESLLIEKSIDLSGNEIQFIQNDLYLLFNQERLQSIGTDTMINYLNSLAPQSDGLAELRSKCSDEQLIGLIKSRHIQSRSELLTWSKFLNYSADELQKAITEASKSDIGTIDFKENKENGTE